MTTAVWRYSPRPAQAYRFDLAAYEHGAALWNLLWLSFPYVDNLLTKSWNHRTDVVEACQDTVAFQLAGLPMTYWLLNASPQVFVEAIRKTARVDYPAWKVFHAAWISTMEGRAKLVKPLFDVPSPPFLLGRFKTGHKTSGGRPATIMTLAFKESGK